MSVASYRRKQTVQAIQWLGTNFAACLAFCSTSEELSGQILRMTITSTGKKKNLNVGDWITKNAFDEFSSMDNDTFVYAYEAA